MADFPSLEVSIDKMSSNISGKDLPIQVDAVVIGASFAGIWTAHQLQREHLNVRLVDASAKVGGSWASTHYPGCRVDTAVPLYEFSDPELWGPWEWSERFPTQHEIQAYLEFACDKLHLRDKLILNTRVSRACWDDDAGTWSVFTGTTLLATATFLVIGTGYATVKYIPSFPGRQSFEHAYHSSEWPEGFAHHGKRVAVIGTGSSGVQCIETMAPDVEHLVVFQRTPNMALPMPQEQLSAERRSEMKLYYPDCFVKRSAGLSIHDIERTPRSNTKESEVEDLFRRGGTNFWLQSPLKLFCSREHNLEAYQHWRQNTSPRICDSEVAQKLAPVEPPHTFGTKRPCLESAYYEAFNLPQVALVDVNTERIVEITREGIKTEKMMYLVDIIMYATGYDCLTGSMLAIDIRGRNGRPIGDKWSRLTSAPKVDTYLGVMTADFPNMFFPAGPHAPIPRATTPQIVEMQGEWVAKAIAEAKRRKKTVIEATEQGEKWWGKIMDEAAKATLFPETDSWYMGANIPGLKKDPLVFCGKPAEYARMLKESQITNFPGVKFA